MNISQTTLDSTLQSVDDAEAIVMGAAKDLGFEDDDQHQIGMAVRECMVNAVVHGNRYSKNKKVHLDIESNGNSLVVVIGDEGAGFDMLRGFCSRHRCRLRCGDSTTCSRLACLARRSGRACPYGLHTGEPTLSSEGYTGVDVHHAARIMSAGHGGQVLLSQTTRDLVEHDLPNGVSLRDLGVHRLKDLQQKSHLFQLVIPDSACCLSASQDTRHAPQQPACPAHTADRTRAEN